MYRFSHLHCLLILSLTYLLRCISNHPPCKSNTWVLSWLLQDTQSKLVTQRACSQLRWELCLLVSAVIPQACTLSVVCFLPRLLHFLKYFVLVISLFKMAPKPSAEGDILCPSVGRLWYDLQRRSSVRGASFRRTFGVRAPTLGIKCGVFKQKHT